MIQACKASGQAVKAWCEENGIGKKTYYYRLKRVRLAALQEPERAGEYFPSAGATPPAFAELPLVASEESVRMFDFPTSGSPAISVHMGSATIDINNGANPEIIATALRALREIC